MGNGPRLRAGAATWCWPTGIRARIRTAAAPPPTVWSEHLRPRLARLALTPARQLEIEEELAQHLDDRYDALRAQGVGDIEARQLALAELRDDDTIASSSPISRCAAWRMS